MNNAQRLGVLAALAISTTAIGPAAAAAGTTQVSGTAVIDAAACSGPPAGYEEYGDLPGMLLSGSLEGCLYTDIQSFKDLGAPSGIFLERGQEVFVGSLHGGSTGTFTTTYQWESKWDPEISGGTQLHGRCQHPLVKGSGTGVFAGATGRLNFKDIVSEGTYVYRGHLSLAGSVAAGATSSVQASSGGTTSTAERSGC